MVTNDLSPIMAGQRKILFAVLCICFSLAKAQNDTILNSNSYKGHLIFSFGLSEPLGDLALQDYSKSYAGGANTGLAFQLALYKPFTKNFGFCMAFHRESFFISAEEIAKANQPYLSQGFVASAEVLQNWSASGLHLGLFVQAPLNIKKSFFLEPRFLFGMARAKSPGYTIQVDSIVPQTNPISSVSILSTRSNNISGTILIGMGLRYHSKSNWCYSLHMEYETFFSEAEFNDVQVTNNLNQSATFQMDMEMKYYTIKLGIGKLFGN